MSLLSQTIPTTLSIPYFGPKPLPLNFFALIVGSAGESRKTTVITAARSIFQRVKPQSSIEPAGSWEFFLDSIIERPSAIVFDEDFGATLSMMGSKGYLSGMKGILTKIYDCQPLSAGTRDKKRSKVKFEVDKTYVSTLFGATPTHLEEHTDEEDWTNGFLSRFFTIYDQAYRSIPEAKGFPELESELSDRLMAMANAGSDVVALARGEQPGKCLGLDPRAWELHRAYEEEIRADRDEALRRVKAGLIRSIPMAVKIAGLLSWDYGPGRGRSDWYITGEFMEIAIDLVRQIHVQSLREIAVTIASDPKERAKLRVYRSIGPDPTPHWSVLRACPSMQDWEVQRWLTTLQSARLIVRVSIEGRPEPYWRRWMGEDDVAASVGSDLLASLMETKE